MMYFAYGSNMDRNQLVRRVGEAVFLGVGRLMGHQFVINNRGVATVVACPSAQVYGLIFELTESQLKVMDRFEGTPAGHYRRCDLPVQKDGIEQRCITYIASVSEAGPPRADYLEPIIVIAKNSGFPQEYVYELCTLTNP